ncbi:hypothetical protein CEXT_248061 [Caerostris extrusa]|uniref:Uncharacterized protein n=1 Tax=Caerostris extrusa TaxID=172846 RepID=A0AAV4XRL7_CAEEX|nr:hypothetical protein CEXT_248061 [Caerostris extrusa]
MHLYIFPLTRVNVRGGLVRCCLFQERHYDSVCTWSLPSTWFLALPLRHSNGAQFPINSSTCSRSTMTVQKGRGVHRLKSPFEVESAVVRCRGPPVPAQVGAGVQRLRSLRGSIFAERSRQRRSQTHGAALLPSPVQRATEMTSVQCLLWLLVACACLGACWAEENAGTHLCLRK